MGTILHVESIDEKYPFPIVLKYCNDTNNEAIARFNREVRYLINFSGNSHTVQVVAFNLDEDPPYFVMKYYEGGDLSKLSTQIQQDVFLQKKLFNKMLDCVNELHMEGFQHRDIKPQNFLIEIDSLNLLA